MRLRHAGFLALWRVASPFYVNWKDHKYVISAGGSDQVLLYLDLDDPESLYILTQNPGLGYIGLERLNAEYAEPYPEDDRFLVAGHTDSFFTQQPDEVKDYGTPLMKMAPHNQIRYMAEWFV